MTNRTTRNVSGQKAYYDLTKTDLVAFDAQATDLILSAISLGCVGRISAKGHAILRNAAGGTAAVPRSLRSGNRAAQNCRSAMRRFLAEHRAHAPREIDAGRAHRHVRTTVVSALTTYGTTFSTWLGERTEGLAPDAIVIARTDADGITTFTTEEEEQQS